MWLAVACFLASRCLRPAELVACYGYPQQAAARHGAEEEGLPFNLDEEWAKVSSFIDKYEEKNQDEETAESSKEKEETAMVEEMPKRHIAKPLYIIIGIAASLLLLFVVRHQIIGLETVLLYFLILPRLEHPLMSTFCNNLHLLIANCNNIGE